MGAAWARHAMCESAFMITILLYAVIFCSSCSCASNCSHLLFSIQKLKIAFRQPRTYFVGYITWFTKHNMTSYCRTAPSPKILHAHNIYVGPLCSPAECYQFESPCSVHIPILTRRQPFIIFPPSFPICSCSIS